MTKSSTISRRLRKALLLGTLAVPILPLTGQTVSPGGSWKIEPWTSDATSGVDSQFIYTHSYSFGSNDSATINGVNFIGEGEGAVAGRYTRTGFDLTFGNLSPNNVTGSSAILAKDFSYGGSQSLTLSNLKPSTAYVFTVYGVGFDASGVRSATFNSNRVAGDSLTVNLNQYGQGNGIRVIHEFTSDASGSPVTISFPNAAGSIGNYHTSGFSNREAAPSNTPVAWTTAAWNDDATSGVDSQFVYTHSYSFGSNDSTTINGVNFIGGGEAPVTGRYTRTGLESTFGNLSPNNVTGSSATLAKDFSYGGSQSLTLSNLKPSTAYVFTVYGIGFDASGVRSATFSSDRVAGDSLTVNLNQYGRGNGIRVIHQFTSDASGSPVTISFPNAAGSIGNFHTSGFSNREAAPSSPPVAWTVAAWNDDATSGVSPIHRYTHAFNFNSSEGFNLNGVQFTGLAGGNPSASNLTVSGTPGPFPNDVNNLTGDGAVMGRDFIYGGYPAVFDLSGLTPNKEYVFTLYSVGWDASGFRRGFFRGGVGEGATLLDQNQFGDNNGIRFEYRYTANATGTNKITVGGFDPSAIGAHLYGLSNREAVALANVAPSITLQPAGGTVTSGGTLTLRAAAIGSPTLSYQWNLNGNPVSGATNPILQLTNINNTNIGSYTVTIANGSGSVTSNPAYVAFQTRPWWDDYPIIVEAGTNHIAVKGNNATCAFGYGDPSSGIYMQKLIANGNTADALHNAGYKYITYYETFGQANCYLLELGPTNPEGDSSVYRYWNSFEAVDTKGGPLRWGGPQNYFDAESFCGPYTRLHPIYGAGGRAMTYPDGTPATGYFANDIADPRKSRVLDAACSKNILGEIAHQLAYQADAPLNPLRSEGLLQGTENGQTRYANHAHFNKDTACPMWTDLQRSSILYSTAKTKIDGIWSDNYGAWDNFGHPPIGAAFGDWSVARFRTYLTANFTTAQLTAMGVSNPATFDIRTSLRNKLTALGGTSTNLNDGKWNDPSWLNDPLWRAYKIFKRQVGTEAITNYYNASKDAAAQMGVPDFAVMGNDIPVFSLGYCRGTLDAVSTELTGGWHMGTSSRGFMMPSVGRFAPAYKVGREHAKSRLLNVWMYFHNGYEAYRDKPGVVNTVYYEMLANQTLPMLFPGNTGFAQEPIVGGFTRFVNDSREIYNGRESSPDVGLYYSTSSIIAYMTPAGFLDMDNQPATGAYNGWATALGNLQYQYSAIPEWKLTAQALAKLRVLVIPNSEVLDSADVTNIIAPWVNAGGRLIVTGNSGARKGESGNFDSNTNLSLSGLTGVTQISGAPATQTRTVGSGKVYFIRDNIGLSYFNASTSTDRASRISGFSTAMNQVLGTDKTLVHSATALPDTVGINVYETPAARLLFVDVNNYNVNLATDVVTPTPATTFTVKAPSWLAAANNGNIRVRVLSPTLPAPTVTVTKSGTDRIQVTLGAVTNYASIVVSETTGLTWNGGGGNPSDSSGTWNATSGNWWTTSSAVWTDLNNAVFGVGTGSSNPHTVTLGSGFSPTVGNLTFANQSYTIAGGTINLGAASMVQVDAMSTTIGSTLAGSSGSLTKTGAGTLVLTGNNTYTGGTIVDSGTLKVMGSLHASSTVSVNFNGTLIGTGTINGPVTVNSGGTIAPGASAGTLAVGSTTLSGTYSCEINSATADRISSTGSITINPGSTLALSTLNAPTLTSYIIASYSGSLSGTFSNVTGTPAGYGVIYDAGLKQIRLEQIGYNRWIADSGLTGAAAAFDADPDNDGVANGLEFVLGGEPNPANPGSSSSRLLPTVSESSGNLVFSFRRKDISESSVVLACQWSTNLIFLSPTSDIPVRANSSVTDGINVTITEDLPDALTDTITITVPAAKTASGKIFIRLKAQLIPSL